MVWPLTVHFLVVVFLTAAMLGVSALLGERHAERVTGEPYESGIVPSGRSRVRYSAHFYLIAMFFVIFDLEAVFVLSWALVARETGWLGFAEIAVFIGVLGVGLAYLWRTGALDWGTTAVLKARRAEQLGRARGEERHEMVDQ